MVRLGPVEARIFPWSTIRARTALVTPRDAARELQRQSPLPRRVVMSPWVRIGGVVR
jgi:hypothetical protein